MSFPIVAALGAALVAIAALGPGSHAADVDPYDMAFPKDFMFSSATASYQIEGAWNVSGKGENVWDRFTHEHPEYIEDGSNGDVACDSYHKFKEDIRLAKELGTKMYRFSLSWSRLLPTGFLDVKNQDGINYYNAVIDECLKNDIIPMITIFHWDLPQPIQDLGGFPNEVFVDYFEDYADFVFETFGPKVKWWLTFNEPWSMCVEGYGNGKKAPLVLAEGRGDYLCAHNTLKAHARAYHLYQTKYKTTQNGQVGMAANSDYFFPKDPNNPDDVAAADRWQQFNHGWFLHPVYIGDYPKVMKDWIEKKSMEQGLNHSRLPSFTADEIAYINGTADFCGINVYTSTVVKNLEPSDPQPRAGTRESDGGVVTSRDPSWEATVAPWLYVVPEGFRGILNWLRREYNNPPVIITENGYPDSGELKDTKRVNYYRLYLLELLKAINVDKCNVFGYTAWSLMDNYEWFYGYKEKYGMYHVDFTDPERPRTPKMSSKFYKTVIATGKVPKDDPPFPDDVTSTNSPTSTPSSTASSTPSSTPSPSTTPKSDAPALVSGMLFVLLCSVMTVFAPKAYE